MIDRISKLITLAENASTEAEAAAAFGKAQALASKFQIDLAMARLAAAPKEREKPTMEVVRIGEKGKHANASLIQLFTTIARANDTTCLIAHNSTYVQIHGMPSDIDTVEALWSALAANMMRFADALVRDKDAPWRKEFSYDYRTGEERPVTGQGARKAFATGYISRIGERLQEARTASIKEADDFHRDQAVFAGSAENLPVGMALVLKDKRKEVEDFMWAEDRRRYGRDRRNRAGAWRGGQSSSTYSSSANAAGRSAANNASLTGRRAVGA